MGYWEGEERKLRECELTRKSVIRKMEGKRA